MYTAFIPPIPLITTRFPSSTPKSDNRCIQKSSRRVSSCLDSDIKSHPSSTLSANPSYPSALRSNQSYEEVLDCVLKVYCTHCEPNYELPWAMTPQRKSTSSAFVIEGRRILTNAHSVEHHTSVLVKKRYNDQKYPAKVVAIGNECDIALLHVSEESFWEDFEDYAGTEHGRTPYLQPGSLPHLQDSVLVIGYPSPGNQISVTAGVASRVEMQQYVHGQGDLLAVQIDAAVSLIFPTNPSFSHHLKC